MKLSGLILFSLTVNTLFAQPIEVEEECIAGWNKGETRTIDISRSKFKSEGEQATPPFEFSYQAIVTVLDSTVDGYNMQWKFQLGDEYKKKNPGIEQLLPLYNSLVIRYTTDESGVFRDLLNWEEVRDAYMSMTEMAMSEKVKEENKAVLDQVKVMFSTKELVEASLIKEIQLYHAPYGALFSTTQQRESILLSNPFGGDALPAVASQQITSVADSGRSFTAEFRQELDSTGTRIMMNGMFKQLGLPLDSLNKYANDVLSDFQVADINEYRIVKKGYRISYLKHSRIANAGQLKSTEIFIFNITKKE